MIFFFWSFTCFGYQFRPLHWFCVISCLKICRANAIPFFSLNIGIFKSGCLPCFRSSLVMSSCLAILHVCEPGSTCEVQKNRFPFSRTTSKVMNILHIHHICMTYASPHHFDSCVGRSHGAAEKLCYLNIFRCTRDLWGWFFLFQSNGCPKLWRKIPRSFAKWRKFACNSCITFYA